MAGSSCCSGSLRLCDDPLNAIHDGAYRRECRHLFIRIIRDFDAESILNIEHDHCEVERFNLKLAERGFERDRLRWVFHAVSYTHLRAHETKANLVCRLLLEKK